MCVNVLCIANGDKTMYTVHIPYTLWEPVCFATFATIYSKEKKLCYARNEVYVLQESV
jgi:hypothetical protein